MLRSRAWFPGLLATLVVSCATGTPEDLDTNVKVYVPTGHDLSPALRDLAKVPVFETDGQRAREAEVPKPLPFSKTLPFSQRLDPATLAADPVVQNAIGGPNIPTTIVNFEGMGSGLAGFAVQSAPPDTSGDIGPNHYVQIVNSSTTVFSRTGARLLGPITTNTLFNGFGGNCATRNDGDGVVRYDRMADRWVISQFSVNGGAGPFLQCVAVSATPDPTGAYHRYQFTFEAFNDYPKVGLWPDAYYFTFNMFAGNSFAGARACAFDRVRMLAGLTATAQCFNTTTDIGGLLASDLDGTTLPPPGSPNFLLALNTTTTLAFFKFHVDFATPANSTFTGPTNINVALFNPLCNGGTCVTQPGTTVRLDSLADRLMNRLVYRRFATHESLLVSHSVTGPAGGGGVRFYELRSPQTTPVVFQQGTYAPDNAFRWMSSLAFDSGGNIGLGFSISSATISPSIRYTGRLVTDALGTMGQGEASIVAGAGAQINNLTRWGDYSSMNIDPTDDCTFWFTQEYIAASGSFNWRTRIGNFKFAECGGVGNNDFSITPDPTARTVNAGATTTYAINTAVLAGAAQTIALSATGLPAGVTASFNPTSVIAGGSSTLTLTVAPGTASSTTQFTITGIGSSATRTATATVTVVNNNQAPVVTITSPANGSTVSGNVNVTANATDSDGTVASVRFDLPDGTSVTDTVAPFATVWNSTTVVDGGGYVIRATATDNQGATAVATVTVTVANGGGGCLNNTFNAAGLPLNIPDNNATGITSPIAVTGNGTVAQLRLSLNITHTFRGDLVVTLVSPGGTQFVVSNRAGGAADNIVIVNQLVNNFNGQTAAGTWQLRVQDRASADVGRLNSWSLTIVGNCAPAVRWSGSATPNLPTIDNGSACTSLNVTTVGGDSSVAKLDIAGSHGFRSVLRGTLAHNGTTIAAFPINTFPTGSGAFSFTNRSVPGFTGDSSGTWTLCIVDTDAFGDVGVLNSWSVHD
jgi:subtilisin-like proprotein convertase family protein